MANNPYVNKVEYDGSTLIDITDTTATASDVASGKWFYLASGQKVQGAGSGGTPSVTQDQDGYIVLDDDPGANITVESLSVTTNGTYTASSGHAYSPVTVNVSGGGGGGDMDDPIRFFDYDGTLVASYSSVPSSLPSVPTHTGLTSGTWNYTLQQLTTQFNAVGTCDVGANYDTVSGATEIDIELSDARLHPYLSLAVNGTISIDWGDGSTPSTSTGTSITSRKSDIHHEYSAGGSYTIKITRGSGTECSLLCTSTYALLNKGSGTSYAHRAYSNCVMDVRVGSGFSIGEEAFGYCYSLRSVSLPSGLTSIGTYAFTYCDSLAHVSIPSSVTSIGFNAFATSRSLRSVSLPSGLTSIAMSTFSACYSLAHVSIPSGVTSIDRDAFINCYSLRSIRLPSSLTSIGYRCFHTCTSLYSVSLPSSLTTINADKTTGTNGCFQNCYSLPSITIPAAVTGITANEFTGCYGVGEYHFLRTESVPTLENTNAFTNIQSDCIIYVPASKLSDYQTAENWSTYASYMVGE